MRNLLKFSLLFLFFGLKCWAITIPDSVALKFIGALLSNSDNLNQFILPSELNISNRLGIQYYGIKNKFLISNDIDSITASKINNGELKYIYDIEDLGSEYSKVNFSVPSRQIKREYYFKNNYLISAPAYYSGNWLQVKSKFFVFHVSDTTLINSYCIRRFDDFVMSTAKLLKYSKENISLLQEKKIHYFFCKNEEEIKKITGYSARGLYYLPYDYIISTYNCHFHELLHLLINYKLKSLQLYTLPIFQEGFAVAYGGRGGKSPNVILEAGLFLVNSGFINYPSLKNRKDFYQYDPSMSYPVSGLYVKFLIEQLGIDKFLSIYKEYSSGENQIDLLEIKDSELLSKNKWKIFLQHLSENSVVKISDDSSGFSPIKLTGNKNYSIYRNNDYYLFKMKDTIFISVKERFDNYNSKLFTELFPKRKYNSEKYAVIADSNEISVYNFYSNTLTAKYARGFSEQNKAVIKKNNFYIFIINTKVFDEPLSSDLIISN